MLPVFAAAGIDGVCVGNGFIRSEGDPCGMHKCIPYGGETIDGAFVGADALCQDHIGNKCTKDMGNTLRETVDMF